jgi:shikimate dehydrogenase
MHNAAIAALGLDAVYVALRTCPDTLDLVVRGVLATGGAVNVTVPHKRAVVALLGEPSELVRRTGACNTVWGGLRGIAGDNTDVPAIRLEAARLLAGRPMGRALVVGTGGSARAAAVAVADEWPGAAVEVLSRDAGRTAGFLSWAAAAGVPAVAAGGEAPDLVVNATPLGLSSADPLPVAPSLLGSHRPAALLDLVYVCGRTRLVRVAREAGVVAEDGRGVLVEQGAAAFRRFFDVEPPREVMRAAVEDALGA